VTAKEQFLRTFEREVGTTVKVLKALPADQAELKPAEMCRSARELAWIFVVEQGMTAKALTTGFDWSQPSSPMPPAPAIGLLLSAVAQGRLSLILSALVFGAGFGLMHPAFTSYVMAHVPARRRGAAFGAMLAAFDTGIGTGASLLGLVIHLYGFRVAWLLAALLAGLSVPYFILVERRIGIAPDSRHEGAR
jgi:MFS family permease